MVRPDPPRVRAMMVTADMAREWLATMSVQRRPRESHIVQLGQAMARNEWRWGPDMIAFTGRLDAEGHPTKGCQLDNGQHRLRGVLLAEEWSGNKSIAVPMLVGDGFTPDQALTFDVGRTRSLADALDFHDGEQGHTDLGAIVGLAWHVDAGTWANRTPTPTRIQQIEFLKNNQDLRDAVDPARRMKKGIGRGSLAGYGTALWLIARGGHVDKLPAFLAGAEGVGIESTRDPRAVMTRTIRTRTDAGERRSWWVASVVIEAWNAFVLGEEPGRLGRLERTGIFPEPIPVGFTVWSRVKKGKGGFGPWAQVDHAFGRIEANKKAAAIQDRWDRDGIDGEVEVRGTGPDR